MAILIPIVPKEWCRPPRTESRRTTSTPAWDLLTDCIANEVTHRLKQGCGLNPKEELATRLVRPAVGVEAHRRSGHIDSIQTAGANRQKARADPEGSDETSQGEGRLDTLSRVDSATREDLQSAHAHSTQIRRAGIPKERGSPRSRHDQPHTD